MLEALDRVKDESGRLPAAVMLVHIHGQMMPTIAYRTMFPNTPIIEDCSQAFACGGPTTAAPAGTEGHIGVFSFKQGKAISAGEGGMAITENPGFAEKLRRVRNHGEVYSDTFGFNFWMSELQAAVALAGAETITPVLNARYQHAKDVANHIRQNIDLYFPMDVDGPPFIFAIARRDMKAPIPKGFSSGYHKPLCCIPFWKAELQQECLLGAHIYATQMCWTTPPETASEAQAIKDAITEAEDSCS